MKKPIDVRDNVTPISEKKILMIDANTWKSMSIHQLYEQMRVLQERLNTANEIKNLPLVNQLQRGINQLYFYIKNKENDPKKNR
ncbi:MAG: hypothetical protein QXL17_02670 [Candidatus Thermoplasmatota archaeon]